MQEDLKVWDETAANDRAVSLQRRLQALAVDQEKARKRTREEWLVRLREIRAMQLKPVERESWELIREDRDSR